MYQAFGLAMASELTPSRLPIIDEQPRHADPSRTSSRRPLLPSSPPETPCISSLPVPPSSTTAAREAPAFLRGFANPSRTQSLISKASSSSDFLHNSRTTAAPLTRIFTSTALPDNVKMSRQHGSGSAIGRNSAMRVKRWAGVSRTVSDWDGLRRDPELWFDDGDCYVHLYTQGQSQRGPSFRISFNTLRKRNCGAMFSFCSTQIKSIAGSSLQASRHASNAVAAPTAKASILEMYIPAPENASRDDSFRWHITTRNFFAYIFGKPLVGSRLGQALVDVQQRIQLFQSGDMNNQKDFVAYAEKQGYLNLTDCADYALAMLYYAEHYKLRSAWIDAFVHCVGMNDKLSLSREFEQISRLSKALITRAYLEMDIHLGRVTVALRNFLEDDLSPAYLGLSEAGRTHLDHFRSFLHGFYVQKFGYWPPPKGSPFSKALYKSMYFDFRNVYDYLVDLESTADLSSQKPATGGICVLQNVHSFDTRHSFTPLPHPLPLLPEHSSSTRTSLRAFTLNSKQAKKDRYIATRAALTTATNSSDVSIYSSPIVQAYMRFERQCARNHQGDDKVSMSDARKIRWLLVYGTLQYLISALRAPQEVRDTETPGYALCCLVTETSPWQSGARSLSSLPLPAVKMRDGIDSPPSENSSDDSSQPLTGPPAALAIQPDCQMDDYFTHTNPNATNSTNRPTSVEVPMPLKISAPLVRNSSLRSLKRFSLSARSSRRNSFVQKPQSFQEILVQGYGNGLNEVVVGAPADAVSRSRSVGHSKQSSRSTSPEGTRTETSWLRLSTSDSIQGLKRSQSVLESGFNKVLIQARTHLVDSCQVDHLNGANTPDEHPEAMSSSSTASADTFWSDDASTTSSKSSAHEENLEYKGRSVEESGLLGGFVSVQATPMPSPSESQKTVTPARSNAFHFGFNSTTINTVEVSASASSGTSDVDSTVGIAVSAPIVSHVSTTHSVSYTTVKHPDPLEAFSALSLRSDTVGAKHDGPTTGSESASVLSSVEVVSTSLIAADKREKSARRKSFWRW